MVRGWGCVSEHPVPGKAKIFAAQVALSNANLGLYSSILPSPTLTKHLHYRLVQLEEVLIRPPPVLYVMLFPLSVFCVRMYYTGNSGEPTPQPLSTALHVDSW